MAGASKSLIEYQQSVNRANAQLSQRWAAIENHLRWGLSLPVVTSAMALKRTYKPPNEFLSADGKHHHKPSRAFYGFGQSARERFDRDWASYEQYCRTLQQRVDYDNAAVDHWCGRAQLGDEEAVRWYCKAVLPAVLPTPPGSIAYLVSGYSAAERHLVLERYVPGIEVIPKVRRYDIGRNLSLRPLAAAEHDRRALYLALISQVALLSVDRIFLTEVAPAVEVVTVNCLTIMRNPATGHQDIVCVLSVSVARQRFANLNLLGVDPATCVYSLNGRLTPSPESYSPVIPWVEAEMTGDLVVTVADTPLLQMDPANFERLIAELLHRMGFRVQSTGRSGDGGVDCLAYDDRPVVGGQIIVQVKRYASTVDPSVVRDLFGTVHARGVTKGVLITTSGFGPESRAFAQNKPLELIDGRQLDALFRQFDMAGSASHTALADSSKELEQQAPPISPDGRYYWDGTSWQIVEDS